MATNDPLRGKLIGFLQDAYAMENQIAELLDKQVKATKHHPQIQTRIQEHYDATLQHRARMEERLKAYDKKPSALKGLMTNMMGNLQGAFGGTRDDALAMSARDDFVVENFEISTYSMIIAVADVYGDQETVRACELNLHDEMVMREWLKQHIVEATLLALQDNSIEVSPDLWQESLAVVQSALNSGGIPGVNPPISRQLSATGGPA